MNAHLDKAKQYLAIAESGDAKREAYKAAAEEIAVAIEKGATQAAVATAVGKKWRYVRALLDWRKSGYKAATPWLADEEATTRAARSHAKKVLREKPEVVTELTPAEQRALARELDQASAKRQKDREQEAARKERDHLGDETVADLAFTETLKSTEYLLIKARGNIAGFVRDSQEFGVENAPEAWRESCITWINDLKATLGMAEALLSGGEVDDDAINEWLSREV